MEKAPAIEAARVEVTRWDILPLPLKVILLTFFIAGIATAVKYIFGINVMGEVLLDTGYYFLLIALFFAPIFILKPAMKAHCNKVPWYDLVLFAMAIGTSIYFFLNAWEIRMLGWEFPDTNTFILATIMVILVLEAARRLAGRIYFVVAALFTFYPLFANIMPGMLYGRTFDITNMMGLHVFGGEGILGIPTRVVGEILVGFLIFAGFMMASGAGKFFLTFSLALLGKYRGGPAKVAVLSSGFFGSLSGSIMANIVSTGSFTIPAMKRSGYPPHYAGAIEACASTGGVLMPPVMGAVAFVMAVFLNRSYAEIIIAAFIPAILYYLGLLLQVDSYAAKMGLKGLPKEEIPSLSENLREGWPILFILAFLVFGLLYMRWAAITPFYAAGVLFLLSFTSRKNMMTPRKLIGALVIIGKLIAETLAVLLPIGLIISGLTITGTSVSLTSGLVTLGGGNILIVLLIGVIACYVLGMAGMLTPAYIFLAISLAPAVLKLVDVNVLALHLFIAYYAMLSAITPPVAAGAFVAGAMAGADPMKTGFQAMRLGVVIYFIPFFFLFNESLILQGGDLLESLYLFILCVLGIMLIAGGMEGYLLKVGKVRLWARPLLVLAGFLIGFPDWNTTFAGAALAILIITIVLIKRKVVRRETWS
ncbi:TRAP transporter permease [Chloroflexota bacterium]